MLPAVLPMHPSALSILDYRVARLSSARALAADSGEARNALNILGTLHFSNFDEFPGGKNLQMGRGVISDPKQDHQRWRYSTVNNLERFE